MTGGGSGGLPGVEGEGSDRAAVLALDRRRPAGAQANLERPGLERLPAWIGVDILRQHRLAEIGRGSAGSDIRTDGDALQRQGIVFGQTGAAQRMNQASGVDV